MKDYHWLLHSDVMQYAHPRIVVVTNDGQPSKVATVDNERAVRQMLRYTQLGQDVEMLCDRYAGLSPTDADKAATFMLEVIEMVTKAIRDTDGSKISRTPVPEWNAGV